MLDIIDKNCKTALSAQVSEKLIHDIRSGKIKPGKRMSGERRLAERFGISRGTVIEALDFLENKNYIERIPAKGTFVADDVNHELSVIKIAFLFPEASISLKSLDYIENWAAVSELYSGIVEEARNQNVEIHFIHFEEDVAKIKHARQFRRLKNIDGAIFIGSMFTQIRQELIKNGKICVSIGIHPKMEEDIIITSDLEYSFSELATLARSKKYKKLRVISELTDSMTKIDKEGIETKLKIALKSFEQVAIETNPEWCYHIDSADSSSITNLIAENNFDLKSCSDIIYCSNTNIIPLFYRYCFDNNIKIGKDVGVFGYASGATFTNLMPSLTYSKINHFEMGRQVCARCIKTIRTGKNANHIELVKNILVKGETI